MTISKRISLAALAAAIALSQWSCSSGVAPQAPPEFKVKLETPKGDITIEVLREWSPLGADRFHQLVKEGFYNEARFFRVVPGFIVQFGMAADPAVGKKWEDATIDDDPPARSNALGTITFAKKGPNTRTSQVFINLGDNAALDQQGFTPFGRVVQGMSVVQQINAEYGESPSQFRIGPEGNAYLNKEFPRLDFIKKATILP
jgi:peptidyl-prolyl cis-trans isomerase A (cyclophilin A)